MDKLTRMDWLKKWITQLDITNSNFSDKIERIAKIKPEVYNEFKEWTPLKLILLNYSLNVCTSIIKNMPFFEKRFYVDLFAGSGLNKIKGTDDFLIGSPLIASLNHSNVYSSMFFCEKNPLFFEALNLRLGAIDKNNIKVMKGECELCLDEILKNLNNYKTYSFFFIDPHCMGFSWSSMEKILKVRSDILFTFMSSEINRAVGLAKSGIGEGKTLTNFFGDNSWEEAENLDDLVEIFKKNILRERVDAPIRVIKVKSEQFNFCYHLFFITNKTKNENKWLRAIDKVRDEIESNSDKSVKAALEIVKKRQTTLRDF